ncbi:winged helix-turn-helix transcriptional regulator [Solwaraspora sp. WMMB335]|uniref:winged helix-turn-helix transcriptional regulator n=1 Tax=Solwaraspora sp. WMMB335 TaxID=3404118 RepID=UPI003B948FCC
MLGRLYANEVCSAARTLEIVGERWSLLIIRNAMFFGMTRFTDFQRDLGVATNILAKRLSEFVAAGVFETRPDARSAHVEYVLTQKGRELQPVIIALTEWGDRWANPDGKPITFEHADCGGHVGLKAECKGCSDCPSPIDVTARADPRFIQLREQRRQRH